MRISRLGTYKINKSINYEENSNRKKPHQITRNDHVERREHTAKKASRNGAVLKLFTWLESLLGFLGLGLVGTVNCKSNSGLCDVGYLWRGRLWVGVTLWLVTEGGVRCDLSRWSFEWRGLKLASSDRPTFVRLTSLLSTLSVQSDGPLLGPWAQLSFLDTEVFPLTNIKGKKGICAV